MSLTSTVTRGLKSGNVHVKSIADLQTLHQILAKIEVIQTSAKSIRVTSGTPGETYSPGSTLRW